MQMKIWRLEAQDFRGGKNWSSHLTTQHFSRNRTEADRICNLSQDNQQAEKVSSQLTKYYNAKHAMGFKTLLTKKAKAVTSEKNSGKRIPPPSLLYKSNEKTGTKKSQNQLCQNSGN